MVEHVAAWPDHKLGGIYAIMDRHGMLPPDMCCARCAKPLNRDGNHPAELYAGTYNGLCYGCTSAGAFVEKVAGLDGARRVSWPPHCPSWRRDREHHIGYEGCPDCDGLGIRKGTRGNGSGGTSCEFCSAGYAAHPVRRAADRWLTQAMLSCQAAFTEAVSQAAGVPRKCTKKRKEELRAAFIGTREDPPPEFAALKAAYTAGYRRIRVLISDQLTGWGYNQWRDTRDEEDWVRAYCKWHGLDYDGLKAQEEASA
jgi:hypothetical protein